jgi:hypothetical protein
MSAEPTRTTFRSQWIVVAVLMLFSQARARAADGETHIIKIHLDPSTVVAKIPDDFLGFGHETSAVAQPGFFSARNTRMIRLYQNLTPDGLIRIGGNVSDHARFIPDGTAVPKTERDVTIINQANLNDLADFARATDWRVMWGLNLGTGTKEEAAEEAVAVDRVLGSSLQSFEIGNEVDLMRQFSKNFDAYHAAYTDYKAAIRARLPHAVFSGPDSANSFGYVEKFVGAESADMALATHHYYRGGARDPSSTIPHLLARDSTFDSRLEKLRALCDANHLGYRINEVNSFFGGGKEGVSDTFASALWCLDYLFDLASHGCAGANLETDINQLGFISFYSPIVHDSAGVCSARPEYYGMLAFAMAGHGELLKTIVEKDAINLSAYATRDAHRTIYLTVINKDLSRDATIECRLPEGCNFAESYPLSAPSVGAKFGVTFAGSAIDDDGRWAAGAATKASLTGDTIRCPVPHASAVVLRIKTQARSEGVK